MFVSPLLSILSAESRRAWAGSLFFLIIVVPRLHRWVNVHPYCLFVDFRLAAATCVQSRSIVIGRLMPPNDPPPGFTRATVVPELLVSDLDASLRFWCDLCGFHVAY